MKKIFFLLFFSTLLLFSCSENETDFSIVTNNSMLGKWRLTDFYVEGVTKVSYQNKSIKSDIEILGKEYNFSFIFNKNHSLSVKGDFTMISTSTTQNKSQTIEQKAQVINGFGKNAKWIVENNQLILIHNKDTLSVSISNFKEDKLVLTYYISDKNNIKENEFEVNGIQTLTLER